MRLLALWVAGSLLAGCSSFPAGSGSRAAAGGDGGAPGGSGGPGGAGGSGGQGGEGGSGGAAWAEELIGHWVDEQIGDCIQQWDWMSFDPDGTLTRTFVDGNWCGPNSWEQATGRWTATPDRRLTLRGPAASPWEWHATAAVTGGAGAPALILTAFVRGPDGRWIREERRSGERVSGAMAWELVVELARVPDPEPCVLDLRIVASIASDGPEPSGTEEVAVRCTRSEPEPGRIEVAVDWNDLPTFSRHPAELAWILRSGVPVLLRLDAATPDVATAVPYDGLSRPYRWSATPPPTEAPPEEP